MLLTSKPVINHQISAPDSLWKQWIEDNSGHLLSKYKHEVSEYGIWLVTRVIMTKRAQINILQDSKKKVDMGFTAEVAGIGKIDPHAGWNADTKGQGWMAHGSVVSPRGVVDSGEFNTCQR